MPAARLLLLLALLPLTARGQILHQGLFRGRLVTYAEDHGRKLFEGDMILDHVEATPGAGASRALSHRSFGAAYNAYLWPANAQGQVAIPYIVTSAATELQAALTAFNATFAGIIQFVPATGQADYVNFDFDPGNLSGQCESNVGHLGGEQSVGGSASCSFGTILHELGHTVGLYHEQSRPDRNAYITVNYGNVIKGSEANFDQLSDNTQVLGPFDYASVMMYIPYAFTRNGGAVLDTIPPGMPLSSLTGYSAADIDGIKRLYNAAPAQVTVTSNPPGLSVSVDGAMITTPQSYAWALNSTHILGVPSGAQALSGAAYLYGRWNDNPAAAHSVTVIPGNNTLAQPAASPATTVYTASFVQLSSVSTASVPSGAGSVTLTPAPQSYPNVSGSYLIARQPVTITPVPQTPYQFVTFGGVAAPYSQSPKQDDVPDGGAPYGITAYFSKDPITTITTTPSGFWFTVDGTYYKGPQNFTADLFSNWGTGSTHTLTGFTPSQPYSINTEYLFDSWSDGGALSHNFTVPAAPSTITGLFTANYVPIVNASPSCAATITLSPASPSGFYPAGTMLQVTTKPARGWKLTGWTGDLSGKLKTQSLAVNDEELATANYNATATPFSVASLTPAILTAGGTGGTVKIKGTGFSSGNAVFVNDIYRSAVFVSSKEIDVTLTASDLANPGAFPIAVSSFPPKAPCGAYGSLPFFVRK